MSSAFYNSIIEDEMKVFGVKKELLKGAAVSVGKTYSQRALKTGNTFLDYNVPLNRCAYLYKYASIHTGLVTKYFRKLVSKKEVKSILRRKLKLKICCLGGGPGTDVVGLFKSLAIIPHYHNRIVEVTVLDICGGWRNSFKRIISNLVAGKMKNVPETFIDAGNFNFKLIEVNLLSNLPDNVATILSEADIVCMVKFVSAILGSSTAVSALEVIGEKLKIGTIVLFIDNFRGNVFKPLTDIAGHIGLKIVIGPLHETFINKAGCSATPTEKEMFGCSPLSCAKVSVLGFVKSNESTKIDMSNNVLISTNEAIVDDDGWDTDDESEETSCKQSIASENLPETSSDKFTHRQNSVFSDTSSCDKFTHGYEKYLQKNTVLPDASSYDKFTQTYEKCLQKNSVLSDTSIQSDQSQVLGSLMNSLSDLVKVLNEWQETFGEKKHCCHCH